MTQKCQMQDESNLAARVSALEQTVEQQQQQLLVHGARLMRGVARELLLFAYGDQPPHPGAGTARFQNLARESDPRLQASTNGLNHSGFLPIQGTPAQLIVLMDATIDRGDQAEHYSSTALLEVDIAEAKTLMQNHPLLAGQCRFEADLIKSYHLLRQAFNF